MFPAPKYYGSGCKPEPAKVAVIKNLIRNTEIVKRQAQIEPAFF